MNEAHQEQPVTVSAFRPGDWFGIVGPSVSVFLPPTEKGRVASLWEVVDGGADFDEVLDTLIASGLRALPAFLLLGSPAAETRVVARGEARADFVLETGDQVTVDGREAGTWNERTLTAVERVSVVLDDEAVEPGERTLEAGLVRVSRVDRPPFAPAPSVVPSASDAPVASAPAAGWWAPPTAPPAVDAPAPSAWGALAAEEPPTGAVGETALDAPGSEVVDEAAEEESPVDDVATLAPTESAVDPAQQPEETESAPSWQTPSALDAPSVPGWPAPVVGGDPEPSLEPPLSIGSWESDDAPSSAVADAETEVFDVADLAADEGSPTTPTPDPGAPETPTPWPAPAVDEASGGGGEVPGWNQPAASSDHDGHTVSGGWGGDEFARQQPGIPGQTPAPEVTAQPVATLVFAHGEVVAVDRAVLVGRAPEARRFTSTEQPRLVTVPSPNHEISSTHLEVRPGSGADHGSAIVTDMGSTNGTVLVQPGLGPESLTPGMPVQLLPGALIDLGDGMTIQVAGV